ncbi:MAG: PspA/IM30 family protein [Prochlorothrix sp.]
MGLLDDALRSAQANLNRWLNQAEDPEKLLERMIQDMQDQMIQLRQTVAQAVATQKRTERQCRQAIDRAADWHRRAETALRQGREDQAREALLQRQSLLATVQALEEQRETQRQLVQRLKGDLKMLDLKLSDARVKKDLYVVRARSAEATQRMTEMLGRLNQGVADGAFQQMEDRIQDLEAQTAALQELSRDSLEERFTQLERPETLGSVEQELASLKRQVLPGDTPWGYE